MRNIDLLEQVEVLRNELNLEVKSNHNLHDEHLIELSKKIDDIVFQLSR
jgi:hypothetical protein